MIESRKTNQNINAVKSSRQALLAAREAILSELGMLRQPALAFA